MSQTTPQQQLRSPPARQGRPTTRRSSAADAVNAGDGLSGERVGATPATPPQRPAAASPASVAARGSHPLAVHVRPAQPGDKEPRLASIVRSSENAILPGEYLRVGPLEPWILSSRCLDHGGRRVALKKMLPKSIARVQYNQGEAPWWPPRMGIVPRSLHFLATLATKCELDVAVQAPAQAHSPGVSVLHVPDVQQAPWRAVRVDQALQALGNGSGSSSGAAASSERRALAERAMALLTPLGWRHWQGQGGGGGSAAAGSAPAGAAAAASHRGAGPPSSSTDLYNCPTFCIVVVNEQRGGEAPKPPLGLQLVPGNYVWALLGKGRKPSEVAPRGPRRRRREQPAAAQQAEEASAADGGQLGRPPETAEEQAIWRGESAAANASASRITTRGQQRRRREGAAAAAQPSALSGPAVSRVSSGAMMPAMPSSLPELVCGLSALLHLLTEQKNRDGYKEVYGRIGLLSRDLQQHGDKAAADQLAAAVQQRDLEQVVTAAASAEAAALKDAGSGLAGAVVVAASQCADAAEQRALVAAVQELACIATQAVQAACPSHALGLCAAAEQLANGIMAGLPAAAAAATATAAAAATADADADADATTTATRAELAAPPPPGGRARGGGGGGGGGAGGGAYGRDDSGGGPQPPPPHRNHPTTSTLGKEQRVLEGVHRMVLWMAYGPPPHASDLAAHLCGNPRCVNILHLAWLRQRDNLAFYHARGDQELRLKAGLTYLDTQRAQLDSCGGLWAACVPPPPQPAAGL